MKLTYGEAWWLWRRRLGYSMPESAHALGISEDRLREWEKDRETAPYPVKLNGTPLTPGEWCAIQRRRRGWTLPEVAGRLGISRMTLWKAEHGRTSGVVAIIAFYKDLGYARPVEPPLISIEVE